MRPPLPKVGIVGGAGPMAGLLLCQKIFELCQNTYGCWQDADFPYLLLLNYPFADMLGATQSSMQTDLIRRQLNECFKTFVSQEITIAAIACNTLHLYLDGNTPCEFVHIMKETQRKLSENHIRRALVLCSGTSAGSHVHQTYLDCSYPSPIAQKKVDEIICRILAGTETEQDVKMLTEIIRTAFATQSLPKDETFGVVMGCTEFSVLNGKWPLFGKGLEEKCVVIDSTQALAEGLCRKIFNKT